MNTSELHIWQHCHHCGARPIVGKRYQCTTCPVGPDIDLCENCFLLYETNKAIHPSPDSHLPSNKPHHFACKDGQPNELFDAWLDVAQAGPQELSVDPGFIVRPEFVCERMTYFGGHSFVVKVGQRMLLLTALHVLDELIKSKGIDATISNNDYTGEELPNIIMEVNLYDVLKDRWMFEQLGKAGPMLILRNARTGEEEPYSHRDIAAFEIKDTADLSPQPLSKHTPGVGDPVWLVAKTKVSGYVHQAVVVEKTNKSLIFRYSDPDLNFRATSGAPIINQHREIVGINIGAGSYQGQLFGHANHVENIHWHLQL